MFYSKETKGFYSREIHGDKIPADAVAVTDDEYAKLVDGQASGKIITVDVGGRPTLQDPPTPVPPTRDQIEAQRLRAYADPITGSDRHFAEAIRMQAMGADQAEIDAAKAAGAARYAEIQMEYPWPT